MKRILGCFITTAIAFSSHVAANSAKQGNTSWDSACPTDTALATLLDPNKLSDARTEALVKIGNPRTESYILNFSESERTSSIFDRLVFSVDVVGFNTNDRVIAFHH